MIVDEVDSWRRRISQKVEDIQGHIESSKFEPGDLDVNEIQKRTGDAQLVFILLLSLARQGQDIAEPSMFRTAEVDLDRKIATALEALAMRTTGGAELTVPELDDALTAFERTITATERRDEEAATHITGRLELYRTLVDAINRLSLETLHPEGDVHAVRALAIR